MTQDPVTPAPTTQDASAHEPEWLTVPDLVALLGEPVGRIHRLIEEHRLPATRRNGPVQVPAAVLRDGEPMSEVRGTLLVLLDLGFTEDEAIDWLIGDDDALGTTPTEALRQGRKAEVRRAAQLQG
ncbi:Rv2175c family DNA-binding protein [Agrococcus baldri]|uniref:Transcriptional regulator n=1 Tax=Agrococcus baldri TaxID=153730 RepID=A0AA87RD31_9MICO|nr:Rv2175c family DNA-binding protein [Agrococcus baldri]GEK80779.1 transcriptional regulator [Agrococcus baldri]